MKRFFAALSSLALVAALYLVVQNAADTPLVHVILQPRGGKNAPCVYETVYRSGKSRPSGVFVPSHTALYTADYADFDFTHARPGRVNTLAGTVLYNAQGLAIHPDRTMLAMLEAAARQIDHAIFTFEIAVVNGERYYAFAVLNVNWWDPCVLYEFDLSTGELRELHTWNSMDLIGLAPES